MKRKISGNMLKCKTMKKTKLNKYLFWDVDYKSLDLKKDADFIIRRVLEQGDLSDFSVIKKFYGLKMIKKVAKSLKKSSFDKKSFYFWRNVLNIS